MTAAKVLLAALTVVCAYVTFSQATYQQPQGKWGPWSKWCPCTKKCNGLTWRTRKCLSNAYEPPCQGKAKQTKKCNTQCPIDGHYGPYGPYGPCSKSCGGGYQTCYRKCNNPRPQYGGKGCQGPASKKRPCNVHKKCAIDGRYGPYGPYGPCSRSCGGGYQVCYRKCNHPKPQYGGKGCQGPSSKKRPCNVHKKCPVDGKYGPWSRWSKCSKPCKYGTQTRSRKCNKPKPAYGGKPCKGPKNQSRKCNYNVPCRVYVGFARPLYRVNENAKKVVIGIRRSGDLSRQIAARISLLPGGTAGNNDRGTVDQTVVFPANVKVKFVSITINDDKLVENVEFFRIKITGKSPAVFPAKFKNTKVIIIDNDVVKIGFPKQGSKPLPENVKTFTVQVKRSGASTLTHSVSVRSVDGTATSNAPNADYVRVNPTKLTFGPKDNSRPVTVTIIDDKLDEKPDVEAFTLVLSNNDKRVVISIGKFTVRIRDNDVNGNWGKWSPWSTCTKSCRYGTQSRSRKCNNPAPTPGAKGCKGPAKQSRKCNQNKPCPVHGKWGPWGPYSKCSKTCKYGTQSRSRQCNDPAPAHGGRPCRGPKNQTKKCNQNKPCPVDGKWGPWGSYGACSKSCGGGRQSRSRRCNRPAPAHGGKNCQGQSSQGRVCNKNVRCPAKIGFKNPGRTVPENIGTFKVKITRAGGLPFSFKVSVKSQDGSAKAPPDYVKIRPRVINFGPNDPEEEVEVKIINDKIDEKTENFKLVLSTSDNKVTITRSMFVVRIKDDDVNGNWGKWSPWSKCSKTCRYGRQSRSRKCNNPAPTPGAKGCKGPANQSRKCNQKVRCPAKIGFKNPGRVVPESIGTFKVKIVRTGGLPFSFKVSVKSQDGSATAPQDYVKINPTVVNFGPNDLVEEVSVRINNDKIDENTEKFKLVLSTSDNKVIITRSMFVVTIKDDDVDGKWGPWGPYSKCTKPCGGGTQTRTRKCNKPAPSGGGKKCPGSGSMTRKCNVQCCKVNGGFGPWSKWSACACMPSAYGPPTRKQKRYRKCNKPKPSCGGKKCYGKYVEIKACGNAYLPPCSAYPPHGK